ncbi:MAG: SPOR domain-containing protein [Bacteroidota bacterium]
MMVLLTGPALLIAQPSRGKNMESYTKYEREDVGRYRDRISFELPEPNIVVKEKEVELEPQSLSGYFIDGKSLHIQTDPQLYEWIDLDKEIKSNRREVSGFRIQIYSGSSRSRAISLNAGLMSRFRSQVSYLEYSAPNYVVRIGDFMEREEAILFVAKVRQVYPGAFIVPDKVKVPKYNPNWEEECAAKSGGSFTPDKSVDDDE